MGRSEKGFCGRGRRLLTVMAVVTIAAVAPEVSAELKDIAWDSAGRFDTAINLAPGKFAEVCGPLAKGQSVVWSFTSDLPTNFNIHYHAGEQVVFPVRQDAAVEAQGKLNVSLSQDYCWMWTNKGSLPSKLSLSLRRK